jgi:hypothetical protein
MQLGLRAILLVVAIILFIIAAISNGDTVGGAGRFSGGRRGDA